MQVRAKAAADAMGAELVAEEEAEASKTKKTKKKKSAKADDGTDEAWNNR